jgi:hypothetical protein
MSMMWTTHPDGETPDSRGSVPLRTLATMSSTLLTKRRAVDHCRVRSALCRMS